MQEIIGTLTSRERLHRRGICVIVPTYNNETTIRDVVERCKEQGYTVSPSSFEGFYSADNSDGYNVYLHYDDKKYSMSGTVKAPEEQLIE